MERVLGEVVGASQTKKAASSQRWEIAVAVSGLTSFGGHNGIGEMPYMHPHQKCSLG